MITIKITNAQEIVAAKKGWFVAHVVGAVVDLEPKVDEVVADRLRKSLASEGVEAIIEVTP
jgi:hypothetical protein